MFFEFAALWYLPFTGGSHPRHILSYVPNISTEKILPHTSYVKDDCWNICEVVCYLGKRVFLSQPQKVICTVAKNVWLTARNFWSENIYRRFAYFLWRCLFFAKWHLMLLQSFKMWCNAFGFYHIPMTSRLPWISLLPFMIEVHKKNCASSTDIIVHLIFLGAKIHLCSQYNGSLATYISDKQKDTKKSPTRIGDVWMDNGNISKW